MHEKDTFDLISDLLKSMNSKEMDSIFHHLPNLIKDIDETEQEQQKKENEINTMVKSNNLSDKEQSILFFETFREYVENKEMDKIALFIDKLTYLGFSCSNNHVFSWNSDEDLILTLIDICFLLYQENENTKYKLLFDTCLSILKQ